MGDLCLWGKVCTTSFWFFLGTKVSYYNVLFPWRKKTIRVNVVRVGQYQGHQMRFHKTFSDFLPLWRKKGRAPYSNFLFHSTSKFQGLSDIVTSDEYSLRMFLITIAVPFDTLSHIWRREALKVLFFPASGAEVWFLVRERLSCNAWKVENGSYSASSNREQECSSQQTAVGFWQ